MPTIYLIRHCQSGTNVPGGFIPGFPDRKYGLSSVGLQQAETLGRWMSEHIPGKCFVVTSDYRRAQMTAVLAGYPIDLVSHYAGEMRWPIWMGLHPPEEKRDEFDRRSRSEVGPIMDGVESVKELYDRAAIVIRSFSQSDVLIFTHERWIMAARMYLEGLPVTDASWKKIYQEKEGGNLPNCAVRSYRRVNLYDGRKQQLHIGTADPIGNYFAGFHEEVKVLSKE